MWVLCGVRLSGRSRKSAKMSSRPWCLRSYERARAESAPRQAIEHAQGRRDGLPLNPLLMATYAD